MSDLDDVLLLLSQYGDEATNKYINTAAAKQRIKDMMLDIGTVAIRDKSDLKLFKLKIKSL